MRATRTAIARVRRLVRKPVAAWFHPSLRLPLAGIEAIAGLDPKRPENVLTWLLDAAVLLPSDVHVAEEAPYTWLADVHTAQWLSALDSAETLAQVVAMDAHRISTAELVETWRRGTGGTVAAARRVIELGGRAAVLLGGFHHAAPGRGAGFCAINDVAVAVARVRRDGFRGRITIIDVDAHPPDGTAECLAHDERVSILSLGVASAWEAGPRVVDRRVPPGSGDEVYLAELDRLLKGLPRTDLAFVLAGADPLVGDRLGGLSCTEDGLYERDRRILSALGSAPTVLLPAGGYTPGAWRVFAGAVALAAGSRRRPRRSYDPVLRRSRDISRSLDPSQLGTSEDWSLDEIADDLKIPRREPRVLGFYSRQGIEYSLSAHGILGALGRMGFRDIRVDIAADEPPHRVRVSCDLEGVRATLVELVLSKKPIGPFQTLFIEWMALRDPRTGFTADRPRLPGQDAPGLGMFEEMGQLLMRIAERLGLAGVQSIPAHYHVAWIARRRWVFVDPVARGRFAAFVEHLAGLPLRRASAILDGPGVPVEGGEPLQWEPAPVVAAIDPALAKWLAEGDEKAEAERIETLDRLLPVS